MLQIHDPDILLFNPWIIHALFISFCVAWHMDDSYVQYLFLIGHIELAMQ